MQVVVNHLTRMTAPRLCIAGIERSSGLHVRPITERHDPITRALLAENGGPIELGALVELGETIPGPMPPEVENQRCSTAAIERVRRLSDDEYLDLLHTVSADGLEDAFGLDLERRRWKYAVEPGRGTASLGVIMARRRPDLEIGMYGKLTVHFNDPDPRAYLSVTDARFFEQDHKTVRADLVEDVRQRMRRGVEVYLMLGLARPFVAAGDDRQRHWLQVNGICLADRPLGERP